MIYYIIVNIAALIAGDVLMPLGIQIKFRELKKFWLRTPMKKNKKDIKVCGHSAFHDIQ